MAKTMNWITITFIAIVAVTVGTLIGHSLWNDSSSYQAIQSSVVSSLPSTLSVISSTTTMQNHTDNASSSVIIETLYRDKKVSIPAPSYNPNYNYVTGCYWIDGYYNFSFTVPYSGYVVVNETNDGIPNNFSDSYFSMFISQEKPQYYVLSAYNSTSCTGEDDWASVSPWTTFDPQNNQTMVIPVTNGTNYIILYNGNANPKHGVNPFPINVTFSMKYYGFRNAYSKPTPNWTFNNTPPSYWGKYP